MPLKFFILSFYSVLYSLSLLLLLYPNKICGPFFLVVGLKLNSVDPAMSIDLKYLGVQLPLAPATSFPFWNLTGTNPASPGECITFMKSNKFVNINEKLPLLEIKYVSDSLG